MNDIEQNNNNGTINDDAITFVNQLFQTFKVHIKAFSIYATSTEELELAKYEWVKSFQQAKIEKYQLLNGIKKLRQFKLKYMITPAEFIEFCQPTFEDIGAPNINEAYKEACSQAHPQSWKSTWSHEIVKEAYHRTGNSQFLNYAHDKTLKIFAAHYQNALTDYLAGRIKPQIEYKKPFSISDNDEPHIFGKYEMARPGVMKIYENVKEPEKCFTACGKLIGKGDSHLHAFVTKLEADYASNGLV